MPGIKSILSLLALGSVMVDNPMPQRLVANALRVVALVIVSSMLVGGLVLAIVAYFYKLMLANGILELHAIGYIVGVIAVLSAILIAVTVNRSKYLLEVVSTSVKKPIPLTTHLANQAETVVGAFISGFLERYTKDSEEREYKASHPEKPQY